MKCRECKGKRVFKNFLSIKSTLIMPPYMGQMPCFLCSVEMHSLVQKALSVSKTTIIIMSLLVTKGDSETWFQHHYLSMMWGLGFASLVK